MSDQITHVEIRWRWRARLLLVVAIGALAAPGVWCLVTPGLRAKASGFVALGMAAGAAVMLVQSFVFRLVADGEKLRITSLFGNRSAAWGEVVGVDLTASWSDSRYIYRARTVEPTQAMIVTIVTGRWKQGLHRWLQDVDPFLALLRGAALITLHDPQPPLALDAESPAPVSPLLRAYGAAKVFKGIVVFGFSLMFTAGAAALNLRVPARNLFTDFILIALALALLCWVAVRLAHHLRLRRLARGEVGSGDTFYPEETLFAASSALGGGVLLCWFAPDLVASRGSLGANLGLTALGLLLSWGAVRAFVSYVRS